MRRGHKPLPAGARKKGTLHPEFLFLAAQSSSIHADVCQMVGQMVCLSTMLNLTLQETPDDPQETPDAPLETPHDPQETFHCLPFPSIDLYSLPLPSIAFQCLSLPSTTFHYHPLPSIAFY